jgi:uncharacterized protein
MTTRLLKAATIGSALALGLALGAPIAARSDDQAQAQPPQGAPPPQGAQPAPGGRGRQGAAQPTGPRVNALLISAGAFHDYLYQANVFAKAVSQAVPNVDWTIAAQGIDRRTNTRYPIYSRPDWIQGFDIVIHNECAADVADETFIRSIITPHAASKVPAMVIHCSMHSYRAATVDDWREFLGVTTRNHTPQFKIPVKWADDPIVAGLQPDWVTPNDELYVILKLWPGAKPLATSIDPATQNVHPLAWTHDYKGVRVFGTTLGHGNATWDDPVYQELLVRGFKWALGRN